jgi:hypothetical protein
MNSIPDPIPEDKHFFISLALAPKVGPILFKAIVAYAGSALAFFSLPQTKVVKIPRIGRKLLEIQQQQSSLLYKAATLVTNQEHEGYRLLTSLDEEFPKRLKSIADALVAPSKPPLINPLSEFQILVESTCCCSAGGIIWVKYGSPLSPPPIVSRPYKLFLNDVKDACILMLLIIAIS